jgi:ribosomal protein L20
MSDLTEARNAVVRTLIDQINELAKRDAVQYSSSIKTLSEAAVNIDAVFRSTRGSMSSS